MTEQEARARLEQLRDWAGNAEDDEDLEVYKWALQWLEERDEARAECERLLKVSLEEISAKREAREVAREFWQWVQRVEPDGVDHPGNWEFPYPWLKKPDPG